MSITNTANVTGNEYDPSTGNNTSTSVTPTARSADLSIVKTDSPDPVYVGDNITYTLTIKNNGPSFSNGVTVSDTLPTGVTFVSASDSKGGTPNYSGGIVTAQFGQLTVGETVTVTIIVTATTDGVISNTATVAGGAGETDPVPGNNSSTTSTTVNKKADLSIAKTASPATVIAGTDITFTIVVTNNGPSDASGVEMTDVLSTDLTFKSATTTAGTVNESGGTVTASIGNLAKNASATITIIATVNPGATTP